MTTTPIGAAAALDDAAQAREQTDLHSAAALYPRLLNLLRAARAELPAGPLRTQIDDALEGRSPEPEGELVLENYGQGHAWFRRAA